MLAALAPRATRLVLTSAATPRAADPSGLADAAVAAAPHVPIEVIPDAGEALRRAIDAAPLVCAAGSIFLVGELRAILGSA
jgi:folylpolyglutamate synthase/dihydropteroate synthase